jgi:hypothetical protein
MIVKGKKYIHVEKRGFPTFGFGCRAMAAEEHGEGRKPKKKKTKKNKNKKKTKKCVVQLPSSAR